MLKTIDDAQALITLIRNFVIQPAPDQNTQALANAFVAVVPDAQANIATFGGEALLTQLGLS